MSRENADRQIRRGDRVTSKEWKNTHGKITSTTDTTVRVHWDGTHFEDERNRDQVTRSR